MYRSLTVIGSGPYRAIAYQSATFEDLDFFMRQDGHSLARLDPDEFVKHDTVTDGSYINLVSQFPYRQEISQKLDALNANRFSVFVDCFVPELGNVDSGCMIYPNVSIYPSTRVNCDVIIHSNTLIAHQTTIGKGCFISGHVCIAGGVNLGEYCWVASRTSIRDKITMAPNTRTSIGSTVISNITQTNTVHKRHLR